MDISRSYRLLELKSTASLEDVKASYRRLARRWHPDVNPDNQQAQDMFIRVTQAYKTLLRVVPAQVSKAAPAKTVSTQPQAQPEVNVSVRRSKKSRAETPGPQPSSTQPSRSDGSQGSQRQPPPPGETATSKATEPVEPPLSVADERLKRSSFEQLQELLKTQRLPRAVALVEALGQRLPQDSEVRQWQAIVYQRWARRLIRDRKFNQARAYLKKALSTDPHNRSLWAEVERDFRELEQMF